jgi:hypothetical protein
VWRSLFMILYITKDTPTPSPNGSTMPTAAIHAAAFPVLFFHIIQEIKRGGQINSRSKRRTRAKRLW